MRIKPRCRRSSRLSGRPRADKFRNFSREVTSNGKHVAAFALHPTDAVRGRLLSAQTTPSVQTTRDLHITRVSTPPVLDDYINGAPPDGAMPVTNFIQRNPDDGKPATSKTKAWLAYDDENLYVIFVCDSAKGELRARYTKRDDIFADDFAGVLLDTFDDHQHAFEFFANPYGIQLDGINTEGQGDDWKFDTYWKSEGRVTKDGYAVRMAIPFKSLRFTRWICRPGVSHFFAIFPRAARIPSGLPSPTASAASFRNSARSMASTVSRPAAISG